MRSFAACFVAIQDEFCLEESITELHLQGVQHVLIVSPKTYWTTQEPQAEADFKALEGIAKSTGAELVSIQFDAKTPLEAEALYRNYGSQLLWNYGFDHVLVVDADEFWSPEALEELDKLVGECDTAYQLPFIPTIGVPGYPVETTSMGLVYVPRGTFLAWGRATPNAHRCGKSSVFHFSATRRTLAEVIAKSRRSAHYVEPQYAFEEWFTRVLPNVRPGSTNVHMYTPGANIWPRVRAWTRRELDNIPVTLHPYLGKLG